MEIRGGERLSQQTFRCEGCSSTFDAGEMGENIGGFTDFGPECSPCFSFRERVMSAVEGTPYDPQEDISGGDPEIMSTTELREWAADIVVQVSDAFSDWSPDDFRHSPMATLCTELVKSFFILHSEVDE